MFQTTNQLSYVTVYQRVTNCHHLRSWRRRSADPVCPHRSPQTASAPVAVLDSSPRPRRCWHRYWCEASQRPWVPPPGTNKWGANWHQRRVAPHGLKCSSTGCIHKNSNKWKVVKGTDGFYFPVACLMSLMTWSLWETRSCVVNKVLLAE